MKRQILQVPFTIIDVHSSMTYKKNNFLFIILIVFIQSNHSKFNINLNGIIQMHMHSLKSYL